MRKMTDLNFEILGLLARIDQSPTTWDEIDYGLALTLVARFQAILTHQDISAEFPEPAREGREGKDL